MSSARFVGQRVTWTTLYCGTRGATYFGTVVAKVPANTRPHIPPGKLPARYRILFNVGATRPRDSYLVLTDAVGRRLPCLHWPDTYLGVVS